MQTKKPQKIIVDIAMIEETHAAMSELLEILRTKAILATDEDLRKFKKIKKHLANANLLFNLAKPINNEK